MNADAKGLLDTAQVEEARPATVERYQREFNDRHRRLEQSEQTLAESKRPEDHLRMMIDTIPTLVWSCRPDGTTAFLNQRWPGQGPFSVLQGFGYSVLWHRPARRNSLSGHTGSILALEHASRPEERV